MQRTCERETELGRVEHARHGKRFAARTERTNRQLCALGQIEEIAEHDHGRTAARAALDTRHRALERRKIRFEIRARLRGLERAHDALERLTPTRRGELDGALAAKPIERNAIA